MLSTQLHCFVRRRKGNSLEATATDKEDAEVERLWDMEKDGVLGNSELSQAVWT